jgi:hypothetical protein
MLLLLLLSLASAQEEDDDASLIIEVTSTLEQARAELHDAVRRVGYRTPRRRRDKTVYHHRVLWRPSIHVYDDGRLRLSRAPIRIGPPGGTKQSKQVCVGIPAQIASKTELLPAACLYLDGALTGRRRVNNAKVQAADALAEPFLRWRHALADDAFQRRLAELPGELASMWDDGGEAAVADYACSRTDTAEGHAARSVAVDYAAHRLGAEPGWDCVSPGSDASPPRPSRPAPASSTAPARSEPPTTPPPRRTPSP